MENGIHLDLKDMKATMNFLNTSQCTSRTLKFNSQVKFLHYVVVILLLILCLFKLAISH